MGSITRNTIVGPDGVDISYLEALPAGAERIRGTRIEEDPQAMTALPAGGVPTDRPPVFLVHGWPEQANSWRHQLPALAAAGWHVVAPDLRGFGHSGCPDDVAEYRIDRVAGDLLALQDHLGVANAVLVGHDWGSMVVWLTALLHPERTAAVVGMSVPYARFPLPPTQLFDMMRGDRFFYISYFQPIGVAEAELERDVEQTLRKVYWSASGPAMAQAESFGLRPDHPMEGTEFLQTMAEPPGAPDLDAMPWFTDDDMTDAVAAYHRTGFHGGLSYYRSFDANTAFTADLGDDRMTMPSAFLTGTLDPVRGMGAPGPPAGAERIRGTRIEEAPQATAGEEAQAGMLPGFRGNTYIDGAGHWVQQEAPDETNAFLLKFLGAL